MPKDVLRSDLTPAAKLVFVALAAELYNVQTVTMSYAEIGACCHLEERQVRRSVLVLIAKGLVGRRRLSAGRVYEYRLLHRAFGVVPSKESPASTSGPEAPAIRLTCASCRRPCKGLTPAGICRGCKADFDLTARVKEVRVELGPNASAEQIAERMRTLAEDRGQRRLTARVRRVMTAAANGDAA